MAKSRAGHKGGDVFIVDNSDAEWKVGRYLHEWADLAHTMDIATGYFEIGGLLSLDGQWQKVDNFRILMGDETTRRTKKALLEAIQAAKKTLDTSIEHEKEKNDFLEGVPAIVDAIKTGKIQCRIYRKDKFHAKAYITHGRHAVVGSTALVGSSNFTYPGITQNVELNVQLRAEVEQLQEWYERYWNEAEDITPDMLQVIERHVREYTPFDVYAKALLEFFKGHEMTTDEWELAEPQHGGSRMFSVLDQYQKEGYRTLVKIARQFGGAFLCDGVGLGKTFIGLMLIERLAIRERKNVVLFAPKAALESVWKPLLREYLSHVGGPTGGDFSRLVLFSHSDLSRGGDFPQRFEYVKQMAHAVVVDEAHHFRNPGTRGAELANSVDPHRTGQITAETDGRPSRYWKLYDLLAGADKPKTVYMLTATPINNKLTDFRHMIDLFARRSEDHFAELLGIHSLRGHFVKIEKQLKQILESRNGGDVDIETNFAEAEKVLIDDTLFRSLVVQRSRAYACESQLKQGAAAASFPTREPPRVGAYKLKTTYGRLLDMVDKAFQKDNPLFSLAVYYPLANYEGDDETIDRFEENRQKQVVGLIRCQFLKRFESSAWAFERSCERLMLKLLAFTEKHSESGTAKRRLERWKMQNADLIGYVHERRLTLFGDDDDDPPEDLITEEMLEAVDYLDPDEFNVEEILSETFLDLDEIVRFLAELKKFQPKHDDKLKALIKLLRNDPVLKKHKVLIFTEFADTAQYLYRQLGEAGIEGVAEIDGSTKGDRLRIIRRFAPYYNGSCSAQAEAEGGETRVLISTDVLSEGLNLQDCTRVINYDIHWNPVRLMQRIGRVDRRMNSAVEERILTDHPDQKNIRGKIVFWNFLPPDELNELLTLYNRVTHKTLRISKTLGIEGRKLLTPEDDYDALREFNEKYEGTTTPVEKMHLEFQDLVNADPSLLDRLNALPGRVFSGKEHPTKDARAVFFCYCLPRPDHDASAGADDVPWTEDAGETKWYLYVLASDAILDEPAEIVDVIRSTPQTPRRCIMERKPLVEIRKKIEKHIKNTFFKRLQAPVGVKPILKAWMELN